MQFITSFYAVVVKHWTVGHARSIVLGKVKLSPLFKVTSESSDESRVNFLWAVKVEENAFFDTSLAACYNKQHVLDWHQTNNQKRLKCQKASDHSKCLVCQMHTKSLSWTGHQSHVLQHFDYPATLTERGPLVWQASHNKCQSAMWANQLLKMFLISCFWLEPHRGEQLAGVPVLLVAAGHATLQYASFFHQLGSKYSVYDGKIQSTGNSQWRGRQPPWAQLAPDQVQDQVVQSVDAPPETATQLMAVGGWVTEGADNFFSVLILLLCVFSQTPSGYRAWPCACGRHHWSSCSRGHICTTSTRFKTLF